MGTPLRGNVLDNADVPPSTTVAATGFLIQGSSKVYPPGPNPVTLISPLTGQPMGSITVGADASYVFTPVDGYMGPAPGVSVLARCSNGQTAIAALAVDVVKRELSWSSLNSCCAQPYVTMIVHDVLSVTARVQAFSMYD